MKIWRRTIAVISTLALLLNSLSAPITVLAQTDLTPSPTPVETNTSDPEPTVSPTASATSTPEITPAPTEGPTAIPTTTSAPTAAPEPTPAQSTSPWTFEKVELNKEYVDPQNNQVKLTFTKLPSPAGNIKIQGITLTEDQVKETGSLSNKAYDITSDMENGSFAYNLSLPIPETAKDKEVEVKFAQSANDLSKVSDITETIQKEGDTITIGGLEHFTVFIITGTAPPVASNIIDDGDTNFSANTSWSNYAAGIKGDHKYKANTLGNWAKWTFTDSELPEAGRNYNIYIHWVVWDNHVTNATYELYDSEDNLISSIASVDQNKKADGSSASNGTLSGWYKVPGNHSLDNGYYVQLKTDGSNTRNIVADAVKIETVSAPSEVWVDKNWSSSTPSGTDLGSDKVYGYNAFSNIQNGITAVADGGTINVAAGTYTEIDQIVISKNISIIGADKTTTIMKPAQDTGNSGDSRGWFLVNLGQSITLKNVTLDGSGKLINIGILSHGQGTIDNNIIKNIGYNPSGPDYAGRGLAFYDTSVTITNNLLQNFGRIGIYVYGSSTTAQIESNIIEGKGVGNHLDYAIEVEGGASAEIKGNTISNNKGVADVDGSVSAGILATTYFAGGTNVKIINNSIHDNSYGVALGYNNDTTSALQFNGNVFSNNDYDFDNYTTKNVDARNNIWSVADQNNLDQIEAKINHNCSNSIYVHGVCNGTDDYSTGGMVQYKDIGTPTNSGWNIRSKSATPNETPLDLACPVNTVYTNENNVAQNWTAVSGANIKYQREVKFPSNAISYFEAGSDTYTPFSTFGSGTGIEGLWKTKVRAYVDANSNNKYDSEEEFSGWSNECKITFDKTAPTVPTNGTPNNTTLITNNFDFNWDDSIDNSPITYIFHSSQNPASSGGVLTTALWTSGTLPTSMIHSSGAGDGVWYWQVKATDAVGNESAWSQIWNVTLDTTAPTVPTGIYFKDTVNNKNVACGGITSARNFDVYWNANPESDFDHYEYISFNADGSTGPIRTFTTPYFNASWWTVPIEGTYGVQIRAVDKAGNKSNWFGGSQGRVNSCQYTADWTAPIAPTITAPTDQYFKTIPITAKWTAVTDTNGIAKYQVGYVYDNHHLFSGSTCSDLPNGGCRDVAGNTTSRNHTPNTSEQGGVTIYVRAIDGAGNVSPWSSSVHYIYDATAPTTPEASPAAGNFTSNQSVTLTSSDAGSGFKNIYYTLNGDTPDNSKTLYDGSAIAVDQDMTIKAIAYDNAGNVSDVLEAVYEINPVITLTLAAPTAIGGSGVSDGLGCANHDCSTHPPGQTLGISTSVGTWPKLAYVEINDGTSGEDEEVLGASTSASPTPTAIDVPTYQSPKVGVFKWVLTHKKISLGVALALLAVSYGIYFFIKKTR
jgi:hypothetical protein